MALIVLRAGRITLVDARRAAALRRMSPETGIIGELMVLNGGQKARTGMRYPVIREGMIGSSRKADIRIRHNSVRRRHAWFQLTERGVQVRAHARAPLRDGDGAPARSLLLGDGDAFSIGAVELMLVLTAAPEPARRRPARRLAEEAESEGEALFDVNAQQDAPEPARHQLGRPAAGAEADGRQELPPEEDGGIQFFDVDDEDF